MTAGELGQSGGQAWPDRVGANGLGDRGTRDLAAARASTGMGLVFGDLRSQLGQLGHLVPHERRILRATFLGNGWWQCSHSWGT